MDEIVRYFHQKYNPTAIIVYGSFASGTNGEGSDFDALVMTPEIPPAYHHDHSVVNGVTLDVHVYPEHIFDSEIPCADYIQVFDGRIVLDTNGTAQKLKDAVNTYIAALPAKSHQENEQNVSWCEKMLLRGQRRDTEGFYRLHLMLAESLEIYANLRGWYYFGPQKTLLRMCAEDADSYRLYDAALRTFSMEAIQSWTEQLRHLLTNQ